MEGKTYKKTRVVIDCYFEDSLIQSLSESIGKRYSLTITGGELKNILFDKDGNEIYFETGQVNYKEKE